MSAKPVYLYEATQDYLPGHLKKGDFVEVKEVSDNWLNSYNRTTGETAYLPRDCLQYREAIYRHELLSVYLDKPVICNHCDDYIWIPHEGGVKCSVCRSCFHHSCSQVVNSNSSTMCHTNAAGNNSTGRKSNGETDDIPECSRPRDISEWSSNDVIEWLATVNLYRYCELFKKHRIDGKMLSEVTEDDLKKMRIEDKFHRDALLVCIDELLNRSQVGDDGEIVHEECTSDENEHQLADHTFSSLQRCHKCQKFLYGIIRQGLLCSTSLFGADLESQIKNSMNGFIPDILEVCTKEIEQQVNYHGEVWNAAYRSPANMTASSTEISKVKKKFEETHNPFSINLKNEKLSVIGGIVKKYLRELDNPLLPIEFYNRFIDAARKADERVRARWVISLYNELPELYNRTLGYILSHFCRIIHNQNDINRLSPVFSHIILRPDWSNINLHSSGTDNSEGKSIERCNWFWGDITREEVHEKMVGTQDGTYLVRVARSHATNGDYTLTLRKGGMNRLIKICHRNGKFGFSEPYEFDSVPDLIKYFSRRSLAEYNSDLDITLEYPILRTGNQYDSDDDTEILENLRMTHNEYQDKLDDYERLLDEQVKTAQDLHNLYQASDSFKELVRIFEEQIEIHERNQLANRAAAHDYNKMQENYNLLNSRLNDIQISKQRLERSIDTKTEENRRLIMQLSNQKPSIKALDRRRDQYIKALMTKGYSRKNIDLILEQGDDINSLYTSKTDEENIPHNNPDNWLSKTMDRLSAEEYLKKCKEDETFLIRPGRESPYVLSIWLNDRVHHCKINQGSGGYGFEDPFIIFPELTNMVLHYRENSLAEHNPILEACLKYPAFAESCRKK